MKRMPQIARARWPKVVATLAVLALLLAISTTAAAQGDPWTCDGTIYITRGDATSTVLEKVNMGTSPWTLTTLLNFNGTGGLPQLDLNALAFNPVDNYLYALDPSTGDVYRIGQSGEQHLGVPTGGSGWPGGSSWFAATFVYDPGPPAANPVYLVVRDSSPYPIVRLDVSTTPPTILSQGTLGDTYYDIAFNPTDGQLYAVREDGGWWSDDHSYKIDPTTFAETLIGSAGLSGTFAAAFADAAGRVFVYDLNGDFYEMNLGSGALIQVSTATAVARADGASCSQAEIPAPEFDFGDAPDANGQTAGDTGARHMIAENGAPKSGPYLGTVPPDIETDGQPSSTALLDDQTDQDDEDGLTSDLNPSEDWSQGGEIEVEVNNVSGSACVHAWIDWDNDGFGANDSYSQLGVSSDGSKTMTFADDENMPEYESFPDSAYLRLRILSGACTALAPTGQVDDGEVEDHIMFWGNQPTPVTLTAFGAKPSLPAGLLVGSALAALALAAGAGFLLVRRQRI